MRYIKTFSLVVLFLLLPSCTSQQILSGVGAVLGSGEITEQEAGSGLRDALLQGVAESAENLSVENGYFKNTLIKIPFPEDAVKVANTLRDIGLGQEVDKVILSLNRAAEDAAREAKPIFVNAIKQMTLNDAMDILFGAEDAATNYLKKTCSLELTQKFSPVINTSLTKVNATKYWADVMNTYNKIPLVKKINPDLTAYVTQKALDGLFYSIAKEERKIRENPAARTTLLLQKVFGYRDRKKSSE